MIDIDVHKSYHKGHFFQEFHFTIQNSADYSVMGIYGHSGAGKSTLLKMIAGIIKPDKGIIKIGGKTLFDSSQNIDIKIQDRAVGYAFQDYALFPNMSVLQNLSYANNDINNDVLRIFGIENILHKKPNNLSGGQQQRVSLLRSLFSSPKILLLDEPFSAIDDQRKEGIIDWTMKYIENQQINTFVVSHDMENLQKMKAHFVKITEGNTEIK